MTNPTATERAVYVYRVVVTKWPDWCPEGWARFYTDTPPRWSGDPDDDYEPPELPDELRRLADEGLLPSDFPAHHAMQPLYPDSEVETDEWAAIVCPKRNRRNWLSGAAANRWVRHAKALGAEAHVERGTVEWAD